MRIPVALLALPMLALSQSVPVRDSIVPPDLPPPIQREFRGLWVATVTNMDWPSRQDLSTDEQKRELLAILDRAAQVGLNAIVFQVRPEADALYSSRYEPWSRYLTGTQGKPPAPFWDPLAFAVEEAHKRGMELHAWFNPYRLAYWKDAPRSARHVSRTRPDLVREYAQFLWLDPGRPESRELMTNVVLDVVRRYDVDGVHIDDYFYPYPEYDARTGRRIRFNDDATYDAYRQRGGTMDRGDWRRHNVDLLVEQFYDAVKSEKPWVKVGISPFGIWRPGVPATTTAGLDQYAELYADVRKWLHEGWLDYLAPQLYWPVEPADQSYPVLLRWWVQENVKGRHIWPGLALYKLPISGARKMMPDDIVQEIGITRQTEGATGHIHFNARILMDDVGGIAGRLSGTYATPALAPASPWLDNVPPPAPNLSVTDSAGVQVLRIGVYGAESESVRFWVLQSRAPGSTHWTTKVLSGALDSYILQQDEAVADLIAVTAIDRAGNASAASVVRRQQ